MKLKDKMSFAAMGAYFLYFVLFPIVLSWWHPQPDMDTLHVAIIGSGLWVVFCWGVINGRFVGETREPTSEAKQK